MNLPQPPLTAEASTAAPAEAALLPTATPETGSVQKRAIGSASWTLVAYGAQQVIRLGGNLILTRLLLPEVFGPMSLVNIFIMGLELLSDVGLGPAIINSPRADDPDLLDTAWTIQVIRGLTLFAICILIAWPASRLYTEPRLTLLLIAAGAGLVIRSFTPTRVHTLQRRVRLARVSIMEVLCQLTAVGVTIAASVPLRSAWALLLGTMMGDVARVGLSYWMLPGHRHRLRLDGGAVAEIVHIGRWVIFSTAVTFAAGQLDRLTLGRLMPVAELGIYSLAYNLVNTVSFVGRTVGGKVMYPVLAETLRLSPERMHARLLKGRMLWIIPAAAVLLVLSVWGDLVVRILYPVKFQGAGWMLRILAAGAVAAIINHATGIIWPALGQFKTITKLMLLQIPILIGAMLIGNHFFGVTGFVVGVAITEMLVLPIQSWMAARHKLWQPELDLPVLAFSAAVVALGFTLRPLG